MKSIYVFLLIFVSSFTFALGQQTLTVLQSALTEAQNKATADTNKINQLQSLITTLQTDYNTQESNITTLTQQIAAYNSSVAQTVSAVNWAYQDQLEINGIRFSQWSAIQPNVNWSVIGPQLGGGCNSIVEANVNWNNFNACVNAGVNMNQPYGNWPYGITAFWCGNGAIAGKC
jgi:hypothetical protein